MTVALWSFVVVVFVVVVDRIDFVRLQWDDFASILLRVRVKNENGFFHLVIDWKCCCWSLLCAIHCRSETTNKGLRYTRTSITMQRGLTRGACINRPFHWGRNSHFQSPGEFLFRRSGCIDTVNFVMFWMEADILLTFFNIKKSCQCILFKALIEM